MRTGLVYRNDELAGRIMKTDEREFIFRYEDEYFLDPSKRSVSITLPKTQKEYRSKFLFPFFFNMLSEGSNKAMQCRMLRIDEDDHFGLLLATAGHDTIGAVTVKEELP